MNGLLSAIKSFVLKNRPAYKDYLGNGKYDVKKLPEECVPDSVNDKIGRAQRKADSAYGKADSAYDEASSAYGKASDVNSRLDKVTQLNYNFKAFENTVAKEPNIRSEIADTNGISAIPLAESTAPMKCHFDIVLKDSNNNRIGGYTVFDKKIVRGITKISEMYKLFIDERVELGPDGYAELKIGYQLNRNDNLWHKFIGVVISLPSADINNSNISKVFINAYAGLVDVDNYAPWPSICVPLASTNDAGVVYASDKTDDQTVPVSIDENGYLWCKGSETTTPDWNQNDPTASDYIKNRPGAYKTISPEFTVFASGTFEDVCELQGKKILDGQEFVVETVGSATTYVASESSDGMVYFCSLGRLPEYNDSNYFLCAYYLGMVRLFAYGNYIGQEFTIKTREISVISLDPVYLPDDAQKKVFVTADDSGTTDMSKELIISYANKGYMVYLRATINNGSAILPLTSISSDCCFFSGYIYANAYYMLCGVEVQENKAIVVNNTMPWLDIDSMNGISMIGRDRKKYNIEVDSGNIIATEVT